MKNPYCIDLFSVNIQYKVWIFYLKFSTNHLDFFKCEYMTFNSLLISTTKDKNIQINSLRELQKFDYLHLKHICLITWNSLDNDVKVSV